MTATVKRIMGVRVLATMAAIAVCLTLLVPLDASAQSVVWPADKPPGTCTTDPQFDIPPPQSGTGLISTIVVNIQTVLEKVSKTMYESIENDTGFIQLLRGALTLYVIVYGVLFAFGMVRITIFDFIMRLVKIGIIYMLFWGGSWQFFSDVVVKFFNEGTDDIINKVISISTGVPHTPGDPPFGVLDRAIAKTLSAKMAVTLMAMAFTGMYGAVFAGLLFMALIAFGMSLMTALWVYLMSLVLKTLLFGLAPIFLTCLLFNRTRHLFDGWLNQIVNASLQPILLFIFFAFFATLIEASIDNILKIPVCWTEWAESVRGSAFNIHYWRFAIFKDGHWEPYGGLWKWTGAEGGNQPVFPIDIMTILIFLILAELAGRFNNIVLMVARELAGAVTDLSTMQGALSDWFSPARNAEQNLAANVSSRGDLRRGALSGDVSEDNFKAMRDAMRDPVGTFKRSSSDSIGNRDT